MIFRVLNANNELLVCVYVHYMCMFVFVSILSVDWMLFSIYVIMYNVVFNIIIYWGILAMWLECWFMDSDVDCSILGISMLCH